MKITHNKTLRSCKYASDVTVRALRFCEASILLRDDWAIVEALNPRVRTWLEIYVAERDRKLQDEAVQKQSIQTKKATLRCGGCAEWTELTASADRAAHHPSGALGALGSWRRVCAMTKLSDAIRRRRASLMPVRSALGRAASSASSTTRGRRGAAVETAVEAAAECILDGLRAEKARTVRTSTEATVCAC